jgi:hypothetical protein
MSEIRTRMNLVSLMEQLLGNVTWDGLESRIRLTSSLLGASRDRLGQEVISIFLNGEEKG